MADRPTASKSAVIFSLWAVSGAAAWALGWTLVSSSDALVYARFLAGIAVYPADSAMGMALHQTAVPFHMLLAWLLRLGVSEELIYSTLSALIPALYAQSFALIAFALSGRPVFSFLAAAAALLSTLFLEGADYPLGSVFQIPIFGILGLGLFVLIPAFAGVGWSTAAVLAAVFLGLVHPVFTAYAAGVALMAALIAVRFASVPLSAFPWRASALAAVLVAAAWVATVLGKPPMSVPPPIDAGYLKAYLDHWDYHRNVPVTGRTLLIAAHVLAVLVVLALAVMRPGIALARWMALFLLLTGAGGLSLWVLFHLLRDVLPLIFLLPMPNRFMNIAELLTFPVLFGIAAGLPQPLLRRVVMAIMLPAAVLSYFSLRNGLVPVTTQKPLEHVLAIGLAALCVAGLRMPPRSAPGDGVPAWLRDAMSRYMRPLAPALGLVVLVAAAGWSLSYTRARLPDETVAFIRDLQNTGAVIIPQEEFNLEKSIFRNPILINPLALDLLPYVPGLIPEFAAILEEVYGVDFFNPAPGVVKQAQLQPSTSRQLWKSRTVEDWEGIGRKYQATFLMTTPDIVLPLPHVYLDNAILYQIVP